MTILHAALLLALMVTALTHIPSASAQTGSKVYRFGWVAVFPPPTELPPAFKALKARFAERGYVEGKNITFEGKWADGDYQRIPQLVAELERRGVDVIFTPGSKNARMVRELVKKTPIVSYTCDPFEFVDRLARQGGNVTGVTCMTSELTGKRLELLKEAVPTASRIVFLSEPEDSPSGLQRAQEAAPRLGVKLWTVGFHTRADVPRSLEAVARERPDALFVYPDPIAIMESRRIAQFALKQRLPSMYAYRYFVDDGGLMSYGANDPDMFRLAADQAVKIFEGRAPGDVPVLQATRFELIINMKTARALGITIPPSLLLRADQLIE
jgi:putative tryptophan/tyrosine transport system substrate-binding protein